jgi:hypothetical protein
MTGWGMDEAVFIPAFIRLILSKLFFPEIGAWNHQIFDRMTECGMNEEFPPNISIL